MRKAVQGATLAAAVLSAASLAAAQEAILPERFEVELQELAPRGTEVWLSATLRFASMVGEVDPNVPVDYEDFFDGGVGLGLEARLLWKSRPDWKLGIYSVLSWDSYEGSPFSDVAGDTLEPDTMDVSSWLFGFKAIHTFGESFHLDLHAAIGFVTYSDVDGTFTTGGVPTPAKVFKQTTAGAFDWGARLGLGGPRVFGEIGLGFTIQGAPDDADFAFDSSAPLVGVFDLGIGIRF
jgi:hypothetical protein